MFEDFQERLKGTYLQKVKGECIFCNLIEEEHEKIIFQNNEIAVFPPLKSGALKEAHLLVVPKAHVENVFKLEEKQASSYFGELHKLLARIRENTRYTGANLLSANGKAAQQSIQHLHFHIALREQSDGYDLWPSTSYGGENFEDVNRELRNLLN